jgi:hypothetical protein
MSTLGQITFAGFNYYYDKAEIAYLLSSLGMNQNWDILVQSDLTAKVLDIASNRIDTFKGSEDFKRFCFDAYLWSRTRALQCLPCGTRLGEGRLRLIIVTPDKPAKLRIPQGKIVINVPLYSSRNDLPSPFYGPEAVLEFTPNPTVINVFVPSIYLIAQFEAAK